MMGRKRKAAEIWWEFGKKRFLFLLVLLGGMLFHSSAVRAYVPSSVPDRILKTGTYDQTEARKMFPLIKEYRKTEFEKNPDRYSYMTELKYDAILENVAMQRAMEIGLFYSHITPDGSDVASRLPKVSCSMPIRLEIITHSMYTANNAMETFQSLKNSTECDDIYGTPSDALLSKDAEYIGIGHVIMDGFHYWAVILAGYDGHYEGTPAEAPFDGEMTSEIKVSSDYEVDSKTFLSCETKSITLDAGGKVALPVVRQFIGLQSGEYTTPRGMTTFDNQCSFWLEDEEDDFNTDYPAEIADGYLIARKPGKVTLKIAVTLNQTIARYLRLSIPVKVKQTSLSDAAIAAIASREYTGQNLTPLPSVTLKGKTLTKGTDYSVKYSNNKKAGIAAVTITGIGNYTGTKTANFTISRADISKAKFQSISPQKYNGKAKKPAPKITFGEKTLKKGTDYTLTYSNNKNVGTGSVTIKGIGNFSGSRKLTFPIILYSARKGTVIKDSLTGGKYKVIREGENKKACLTYVSPLDKSKSKYTVSSLVIVNTNGANFIYKVTAISDKAFKGMTNLKDVTINSSITKIGEKAFYGCKNLTRMKISSVSLTKGKVGSKAFSGTSDELIIRIPKKKMSSYPLFLRKKGIANSALFKGF